MRVKQPGREPPCRAEVKNGAAIPQLPHTSGTTLPILIQQHNPVPRTTRSESVILCQQHRAYVTVEEL
jgi:hypothetical protein